MSTATAAALLAAVAAISGAGIALRPLLRRWWARRKSRRDGLTLLVEGRPATHDTQGNVIEAGSPAMLVSIARLIESVAIISDTVNKQLTRNGGSSAVDTLHRIEATLNARLDNLESGHEDICRVAEENGDAIVEARNLAGQAATVVARVEEIHNRDQSRIDQKLDDLRDRAGERFDELETENRTLRSLAQELGVSLGHDTPGDDPAP